MKAMLWIGWYGFLESLRRRLLLGMLFLVLPLMVTTWLLDTYQVGFQVKVVKDLGLNLMSGFGLLIVVFLSLDQIIPDIERKSIYFVLTRIGSRFTYLIGRFLGLAATLAFFHGTMSFVLLLLLRWHDGAWFWEILVGAGVVWLKQCVLVSIVLLLATCTTKIVVVSLSVLIYVLGHGLDIFRMLIERKSFEVLGWFLEVVSVLLPDFGVFELQTLIVHEIPIQLSALLLVAFYSLTAVLFYLTVGGVILSRRDV